MQINVQERFLTWLSERVSSAQLSEYYIVCKNIENFCISKHILVAPLFETTEYEILQDVLDTIRTNRIFQFKYSRQLGKMKKAIEYYLEFLRQNPVQKKVVKGNVFEVTKEQNLPNNQVTYVKQDEDSSLTKEAKFVSNLYESKIIDNNIGSNNEANSERISDVSREDAILKDENLTSTVENVCENVNENICTWNFADELIDLSTTAIKTVSYFGDIREINNWRDAFVYMVSSLQDDYPAIIRGMVGYRFTDIGKVVLSGKVGLDRFNNGKEISNGLYLETDCMPNEVVVIVRLLMDKCNVDFDNIEITYERQCSVEQQVTLVATDIKAFSNDIIFNVEEKIKKNRVDFITWAQAQQMQLPLILAYMSDIKKCNEFIEENGWTKEEHLLLVEDANVLEDILVMMQKDNAFMQISGERKRRFLSAMNLLIDFRKATSEATLHNVTEEITATLPIDEAQQEQVGHPLASSVDIGIKEQYTAVLTENFADGFRPSKTIDRNRFRMYYNDMFGRELEEDDEQLVGTLMQLGTLRNERIFVKDDEVQKDLLEEINDIIVETFSNGASCIYLECLFSKFQEQLSERLHIYSVDSLESILLESKRGKFLKRYNYLYEAGKEPSLQREVTEYMKTIHFPVTYDVIEQDLWYIPLDRIKYALVTTPEIVNVAPEAYLYAPNLPVNESEIQQIIEMISHALLQRKYISDVELMKLIEEHCPSVLMNTPDYPMWGLRNALAYLLRERFSFMGAIISDKKEEISMAEVFLDFCQRSEHITVDELKQFASELNTVIYWDSVYNEMVRVNQNEFVRRDQIHFDIEQTDAVLDNLIHGIYTPIKTINLFLHFPSIDVPWNNFVLESYTGHYSKKFRLLHASYAATDCCGAIVRQDSGITDYRTLIVDVLVKNAGWKNEKDALQLLVDLGYQQRRSYSDIEKVMQEAKAKIQDSKKEK